MSHSARQPALASAISITLLVSAVSCASGSVDETAPDAPSPVETIEPGREGIAAIAMAFNVSAVASQVFLDTEHLAEASDLVVTGTIEEWVPGVATRTAAGMDVGSTIVARMEVDEVLRGAGAHDVSPGDSVWISQIGPTMEPAEVASSLPVGVRALAYLDGPMTADERQADEAYVVERRDERTAAVDLWLLFNGQSLVVDDPESGGIAWPLLGNRVAGELRDAAPGGPLDGLNEAQAAIRDDLVARLETSAPIG